MANIEFSFGAPIDLSELAAPDLGGTMDLPPGLPTLGGVYMILNTIGSTFVPSIADNRYLGIAGNIRERFRARQAVVFELGLCRRQLSNLCVYCGNVRFKDNGALTWTDVVSYSNPAITLDSYTYDFENILIKSSQHLFGGTITNTLKVDTLRNQSSTHAIDIVIKWVESGSHKLVSDSLAANAEWT